MDQATRDVSQPPPFCGSVVSEGLAQIAVPGDLLFLVFVFLPLYERCAQKGRGKEEEKEGKRRKGERDKVTSCSFARWQKPKHRLFMEV